MKFTITDVTPVLHFLFAVERRPHRTSTFSNPGQHRPRRGRPSAYCFPLPTAPPPARDGAAGLLRIILDTGSSFLAPAGPACRDGLRVTLTPGLRPLPRRLRGALLPAGSIDLIARAMSMIKAGAPPKGSVHLQGQAQNQGSIDHHSIDPWMLKNVIISRVSSGTVSVWISPGGSTRRSPRSRPVVLAIKPFSLEHESVHGVWMQMARQHAGFADRQQVAPLALLRVQHERTKPHVFRLRHPHPFVFRYRCDRDLGRGKGMGRALHITINGAFSFC